MDTGNSTLYDTPDLARIYDLENPWGADFDACAQMAQDAQSVLDLGCGTGELVAHLAPKTDATGVDPAAAMLGIARTRMGGDRATWVQGDARDLDLGRRFDLVVLTGHTFQVFLTEPDQRAVLATIARHLSPNGQFIFDTRNPDCHIWQNWTANRTKHSLYHADYGQITAWTTADFSAETNVATYHTHYQIAATGQILMAEAQIKFTPLATLKSLIRGAGLRVDNWQGDWAGGSLCDTSADFIPVGRLL